MATETGISISIFKNTKIIWSLIILGVVSMILLAAFFTSKRNDSINQTESSKSRIDEINDNMTAYMGEFWPYILIVFYILFFTLVYMVFVLAKNTEVKLTNIDESRRRILIWVLIIFIILFCVSMTVIASNSYINNIQKDFIYDSDKDEAKDQRTNFVMAMSLSVVSFIIFILLTRWLYKKYTQN